MKLKDWIEETSVPVAAFARIVGVSRTMVYHWINGNVSPSDDEKHAIERATVGKVRADRDWSK